MDAFKKIDRYANSLIVRGQQARQESGPGTKVAGWVGGRVTGTLGAGVGGVIGILDRATHKVSDKSHGEIFEHGQRGEPDFRQTIVWQSSNLVKSARSLAIPAAIGLVAAGAHDAWALWSGAGLWGLTGGAFIGLLAGVAYWAATTIAGGAWSGAKQGFKAGAGAASIVARKVERLFKGDSPTPARLEPPVLELPAREPAAILPARVLAPTGGHRRLPR